MQSIGAEQPVVVKKLRNGSGAKGLCYLVLKIGQPIREELMDKIKSFWESFKRLDNGSRMNRGSSPVVRPDKAGVFSRS